MTEHIAVVGASRGVGLATVREALARGHSATGLARKPPSTSEARLAWVGADVADPAALAKALEGATVVVTALGNSGFGATTLFSDAARAVTAAMAAKGIQRLVAVTGFGAGDSRGHGGFVMDRIMMPLLMGRVYADKDREEAIVSQTTLDWTLVRPGRLTDGPATGRVAAMTSNYHGGTISRADVAGFVLDCIEKHAFVRQAPVIVGG